jgi:pimeloyl-ACP methyl ester carboxylesterase
MTAVKGTDMFTQAEHEWNGGHLAEHVREFSVEGRRLRFLDVGEGPPLLLVHGLGGSWRMWHRNIAKLAVEHRVLAVDLPGFGHSDALDPATGILGYAQALEQLLDHAGIDQAVVAGHSLGGLVVQHLAIQNPDRVAGLMIVGSGDGVLAAHRQAAFLSVAVFTSALQRFGPPAPFQDRMLRGLMSVGPLRRRLIARAVHDPSTIAAGLPAEMIGAVLRSPAMADAIRAGLSNDADASQIRCPSLVVAGDRDRMVPPECGRSLAARIPGARFELWEEVGHHPMMERPTQFNRLLHTFCADVTERPDGS